MKADDPCERRYRDLLGRLRDVADRLERIEQDQGTFLEILRDFRELVQLVVGRVRALNQRVDRTATPRATLPGHRERIARHLRN